MLFLLQTRTGRWAIKGEPSVILFEIPSGASRLRDWRSDFLERTKIRIPWLDCEVNDALIFGYMVAAFFDELCAQSTNRKIRIISHFHEWIASFAMIVCRLRGTRFATVFTTHATLLGRHLSEGRESVNWNLQWFDSDSEAAKRGFYYRYCVEKLAANVAHVVTTVSGMTADEIRHFLGRNPDVITPNGMNGDDMCPVSSLAGRRASGREKLNRFVRGHFYGHMNFDIDQVTYMFLAGRYEYRNKGCDFFLEALARLNHRLKESQSSAVIVAFIIMPAQTSGFNKETLQLHQSSKTFHKVAEQHQDVISSQMIKVCMSGTMPSLDTVEDKEEKECLIDSIRSVETASLPPICTHNMLEDSSDLVLNEIRRCNLFNRESDFVKVVFHPEFLSMDGRLLPMSYEEFMQGCDLGVFPSFYEPWGYTPAECAAMGVPCITTNLSGYGSFIEQHIPNPTEYGVTVLDRKFRSSEDSLRQLTDCMFNFTCSRHQQRVVPPSNTSFLRSLLDWRALGLQYRKARNLAYDKSFSDNALVDQKSRTPKVSVFDTIKSLLTSQ